MRSEITFSLEIILNAFKCLTVSLSTEILISPIAQLPFISVGILCEIDMLLDVYIVLSPQEEEVYYSSWGEMYTSGSTVIKNIKPFTWHYISMSR